MMTKNNICSYELIELNVLIYLEFLLLRRFRMVVQKSFWEKNNLFFQSNNQGLSRFQEENRSDFFVEMVKILEIVQLKRVDDVAIVKHEIKILIILSLRRWHHRVERVCLSWQKLKYVYELPLIHSYDISLAKNKKCIRIWIDRETLDYLDRFRVELDDFSN